MKKVDEELNGLIDEFVALPSFSTSNPMGLVNYCTDLEKGVMAVCAIGRSLQSDEVDVSGVSMALDIMIRQLMFNVRVMRLLLMRQAGIT